MGGIFFIFLFSIFSAVGIGALWISARNIARARSALNWPAAPATIESCELAENSDSDGTNWSVKVRYTYNVGPCAFTGERVAFGYNGSNERATHVALLKKLSAARTVSARYNPLRPAESTLTTGTTRENFNLLAFAVTWLIFVIGFAVTWILLSGLAFVVTLLAFVVGFAAIWSLASGSNSPLANRIEVLELRDPEVVR